MRMLLLVFGCIAVLCALFAISSAVATGAFVEVRLMIGSLNIIFGIVLLGIRAAMKP